MTPPVSYAPTAQKSTQKAAHSQAVADNRLFSAVEAAYLHIPFCRRRCHYCDFATGQGTPEQIEQYVKALCRQIKQLELNPEFMSSVTALSSVASNHFGERLPLQTVFFGGGTPSLLSPEQLTRVLTILRQVQPFAVDAELSLEANPGTVDRDRLEGFRAAGINRISLGVQAFQAELLEACGRLHGVEEVYQAVADIKAVGFQSFNLDLIFGLPYQTLEQWRESLEAAIALEPPHISLYDLTIEPGTRFGRLYQPGDQPLPSDESTVVMYKLAIELLEAAGYSHYEISNFAKPGHQCRHNRVYWENRSYHGLGMGATGYAAGRRYEQPKNLSEYFELVDSECLPSADIVDPSEELADQLMLGLRLREGLAVAPLMERFGQEAIAPVQQVLESYVVKGWVEMTGDRWRLLPPEGWLFSNTLLVDLLEAILG
ncbi:MAG: radical SAM family heme chaperone HemW [Cyanobacteria bacterium J06649_4]